MKRTVVVEYVGLEDVFTLANLVNAVQQNGHYASVEFCVNHGNNIKVVACNGGFDSTDGYDLLEYFDFGECEEDVAALNRAITYLEQLKNTPKEKVEVPF